MAYSKFRNKFVYCLLGLFLTFWIYCDYTEKSKLQGCNCFRSLWSWNNVIFLLCPSLSTTTWKDSKFKKTAWLLWIINVTISLYSFKLYVGLFFFFPHPFRGLDFIKLLQKNGIILLVLCLSWQYCFLLTKGS